MKGALFNRALVCYTFDMDKRAWGGRDGDFLDNDIDGRIQTANQIKQLRTEGVLLRAIEACKQATKQYPDENFFYKILGDMQYELLLNLEALDSYMEFAKRIGEKTYLIANLFRFVNKLRTNRGAQVKDKVIYDRLTVLIGNDLLLMESRIKLVEYISNTIAFPEDEVGKYTKILDGAMKSSDMKKNIDRMGQEALYALFFGMGQRMKFPDFQIRESDYKVIVSAMEKNAFHTIALRLTGKMLKVTKDGVVVRTLFRICRQLGDYSDADRYLERNPQIIERDDFNIQYELVYYYKWKKDNERLRRSLNRIKSSAQGNPAISKTLYNFYVQFEMLSEAEEMIVHMEKLNQERMGQRQGKRQITKGEDTATETDEGVWSMLRDIVSEKEHNRQLIATKDLIKGFSHELGQPLTNIRYDIGFYFMKKKYGKAGPEDFEDTLNNILRQISRIDKLMKRFSPIFSSKSENVQFCVMGEIRGIFEEMNSRLKSSQVQYNLHGDETAALFGDPLKFHQIFYNLIINSVHAIRERGVKGMMECSVQQIKDRIVIRFSDNGKGIPGNLANKVFEPFFSTKHEKLDSTRDEGGEGLGLYIVWNIVKMFNGTIRIDKKYRNGALFIIDFETGKRG